MSYELKVEVSHGKAKATLATEASRDAARGETDIDNGPLRLDTVRVLHDWLSRWKIVSEIGAKNRDFPVADTFRVLGEHLYQIVFRNDVANGFDRSYREAKQARQPLHVILSFAEDCTELAVLPWEFLYRHGEGDAGFYLATETHLVLNRSLPVERADMPAVGLPLRVLFIMCFPTSTDPDPEQATLQEQILGAIHDLAEHGREKVVVRIVENWEIDSVEKELKNNPHVVHIIGHAHSGRDDLGRMRGQIGLPIDDGTLQWNDPQTIAELLTRDKSGEELPRLVILHLCEMKPIDFKASFERLAPELIKAGILAVLAMQYPLSARAATRFTSHFYDRLIAGDEIDEIVQDVRYHIWIRLHDDRLIGTPVLYMQSLGGRLVAEDAEEAEVPCKGKPDPHQISTGSTATGSSEIRQRLSAAAWPEATNKALARELDGWIKDSDWSDDPAVNEQRIREHMKLDPYVSDRGPMYFAMIKELREWKQ